MPLGPAVDFDPFAEDYDPFAEIEDQPSPDRPQPTEQPAPSAETLEGSGLFGPAIDYDPFAEEAPQPQRRVRLSDLVAAEREGLAIQPKGRRQSDDVGLAQHLAGEYLAGFGATAGEITKGTDVSLQSQRAEASERIERIAEGQAPIVGGIGVKHLLGTAVKYLGGMSQEDIDKVKAAERRNLGDPSDNFLYQLGDDIDDYLKNAIATNPELSKQFFAGDVTRAMGSMTAFILGSAVTRGMAARAGAPGFIANFGGAGALGSAAGRSEAFERALKKGASFEDAYRASDMGAVIGASEGVPIANLLDRFDKASGGRFKRGIINLFKQGGEEAVQEGFTQIAQNAVESKLVAYNPEKGLWEGAVHGGAVGFTTGGILGFLAGMLGGRKGRGAQEGETAPPPEGTPEGTVSAGEAGFLPEVEEDKTPAVDEELAPEQRAEVAENLRDNFNLQDEAEIESIIDAAQAETQETPETRKFREVEGELKKTSRLEPTPETEGERIPEAVIDPRLKRENIRNDLQRMSDQLVPGGGLGVVTFDEANADRPADQEIPSERLPSLNPDWFQAMAEDPKTKVTVEQARNAVQKALNGEKLGVREERVVRTMLDVNTLERTSPENVEFAQDQLVAARRVRAALREGVPPTVAEEIPVDQFGEDVINAGQLLEEELYAPDMDGQSRSIQEIYTQADELGLGEQVDRIDADDALTEQQKALLVLDLIEESSRDQKESGRVLRTEREGEEPGGTVPDEGISGEALEAGGILQEPGEREAGETGPGAIQEAPPQEELTPTEELPVLPEEAIAPPVEPEVVAEEAPPVSAVEPEVQAQPEPAIEFKKAKLVLDRSGVRAQPEQPTPPEEAPPKDNTRPWEKGEKQRLVKLIEGYKKLGKEQQVKELQETLNKERPSKLFKIDRLERGLAEERKIAEEKAAQPDLKPSKPTKLNLNNSRAAEEATGKEGYEIPLPEYVERQRLGGKLLDELTHDELKVAADFRTLGADGKRIFPKSNSVDDLKAFLREDINSAIEFNRELKGGFQGKAFSKRKSNLKHRRLVQQALKAGKEVPAEVLAEYPDLKPKAKAEPSAEERIKPLKEKIEKEFEGKATVSVVSEPTVTEGPQAALESVRKAFGSDQIFAGQLRRWERGEKERVTTLIDEYKAVDLDASELERIVDLTHVPEFFNLGRFEHALREAQATQSETKVGSAAVKLATQLSSIFSSRKDDLTWQELFRMADVAFGGTQAEGAYSVKEAYDAAELALNLSLFQIPIKGQDPAQVIKELKRRQNKMPTQTKRDQEQIELQQFSTPHPHSFVAAWVANINQNDVVMEPSAGTGNLVTHAMRSGAKEIIANELSERRSVLLKRLLKNRPSQVFSENAADIDAILPKSIRPTVVLMNPPFSADVNQKGRKLTQVGANHMTEALNRLEDGGRLVAILGRGMARDKPKFRKFWANLEARHNVRANIEISGKEYRKFGTSFDNVIVVIDKTGPTDTVVEGKVEKVEELPQLLESIRNDRTPQGERAQAESGEPSGVGRPGRGPGPGPTVQPATGETDTGAQARRDREGEPGRPAGAAGTTRLRESEGQAQPTEANRPSDRGEQAGRRTEPGRVRDVESAATGQGANVQLVSEKQGRALGDVESAELGERHELEDTVFEEYRSPIKIKGAQKHTTPLAESSAMAAVQAPPPKHNLTIPDEVISTGALSDVQLESVVRGGEAHETILPNGERQGYFVGDGAGVGKGRTAVGFFLDNWNKGRKKHIWVSENQGLFPSAQRDMDGVGLGKKKLVKHGAINGEDAIAAEEGVMFTTYDTLKNSFKGVKNPDGGWIKEPKGRVDQIVEWVGKDYDGVIVFDEAHNMKNATDQQRGARRVPASHRAMAALSLKEKLPKARIVYMSATGFTEVSNMAYATRLGLWGEGTAFSNQEQFVNQVESGGVAAMEVVAKDLKAMGLYNSRALSYEGVEYSQLTHDLTKEQIKTHNTSAQAWQKVRAGMEENLKLTNANGKAIASARSAFSSSMQEFFNATITSYQIPAVIEDIQKRLDNGEQAVIQLFRTGESTQNRRFAQAERDGMDIGEINITPADVLIQYLQNNFPTTKYTQRLDEEGRVYWEAARDSEGNILEDPEAVAARDDLILEVAQLQVPESVLDQLINHTWTIDGEEIHGSDLVAEVTGRSRRVIRKNGDATIEKHGPRAGLKQTEEFQKGRRRILIFSEAGGTGRSYHADRDTKNKRKRAHYLVQPGWRADKAVQGLGRSHRNNQYQPPEYILVSTDLPAQKRFLSTIARRLDQLGALTKGSRDTGSQGMFDATMNLESEYGKMAIETMLEDVRAGVLDGIGLDVRMFREELGIHLVEENGEKRKVEVPVTKLLNSMLALDKDAQTVLFDEFLSRVMANVEYAKEHGFFDVGMETVRAQSIKKVESKKVSHTGRQRGETEYVKLEFTDPVKFIPWKEIGQYTTLNGVQQTPEFYRNKKSGKLYAIVPTQSVTNAKTGQIVERVRRIGVSGAERLDLEQISSKNYERVRGKDMQQQWEAEIESSPQTHTRSRHLISGALLPVWDRMPTAQPKIIRMATDDGEVLLGREIPPKQVGSTLKALGIAGGVPKLSPSQFFERVMEAGETLVLSNGWKIFKRRVSNDNRMELNAPRATSGDFNLLRQMGAFTEVIGHNIRVFLPTKDHSVLERVIASKPVAEIITADGSAKRGPVEESSVAVDKLESGLNKPFKQLRKNGFPVEVVETVEQLPVPAYVDTKGLYWGGRIFLVAENIGSLKEARRVLAHEAVGHAGLEQMLGQDQFESLIDRVISELELGNATITQAAKAVSKTHGELDDETMAKEVLAYMAENGIQNSLVRSIVAKVREWLAKLGLGNLATAEINTLLARAARFTESAGARDDQGRFISDTPLFAREGNEQDQASDWVNNRMIQFIKKGQPLERTLRTLTSVITLGKLQITEKDGARRLNKWYKKGEKLFTEREAQEDGPFSWLNLPMRVVRIGMVDKYGVSEKFVQRKNEKKAEVRKLELQTMEFLQNLMNGGVQTRQEWATIKDVLEGKQIENEQWMKLAEPIRASIDALGLEAVHLGLISAESYERLKGVYLHRVYLKHEASMTGAARHLSKLMRWNTKRIAGNTFKGRGMFDKIEQKRLLRDVDESFFGRTKVEGKADLQLKGQKFIILDDVRQRGEGVDSFKGIEEGGPKPRVVRRVYWPADKPIPDRMADYVNRGTWEVRGTEKGKLILWRDFTKEERVKMGEIVDARYVIAKTFSLLSHDIANAKFFKDISNNPEWTWQDEGEPPNAVDPSEKGTRTQLGTFAKAEWVKMPNTTIAKTDGVKSWGDLAGKYVRAEIYRDLIEIENAASSGYWKVIMDQWKLMKTSRNPVVHMNNVMSNLILMDLIDVRFQDLYNGLKSFITKDEAYQEAFAAGTFGHSFLDQELRQRFMQPALDELMNEVMRIERSQRTSLMDKTRLLDVMFKSFYKIGKGIEGADMFARMLYQAEDEVFRMAAFHRRRELGDTVEQASAVAVRQFLDYDISAPWINTARRNFLPFIAYTYRAVPVIAEAVVTRPWKLAKYVMLAYGWNVLAYALAPGDEEEERRSLREQEQGKTWIMTPRMMRMPWRDSWGNPIFLDIRRWIPASDIAEIGQGQLLPAYMIPSGPLVLAFEAIFNHNTFLHEDIYDPLLDDRHEQIAKAGGHVWRGLTPGWAPGGWYWERVGNALKGAEDRSGRRYPIPYALTSSVGVKFKPQDVQQGFEGHKFQFDIRMAGLRKRRRQLKRQRQRKMISQEAFETQLANIQEKMQRAQEKTGKLIQGE